MKIKQKNWVLYLSVAIVGLIEFLTLLIMLKVGYSFKVDRLNEIFYYGANPFWIGFFKVVTCLGNWYSIVVIGAVLIIFAKDKKFSAVSLFSLGFSALLMLLIKVLVKRPRPTLKFIDMMMYSFPSGHALMTFVLFGLIMYYLYKYINNKYFKYFGIAICAVLIIIVGISRVYLGAHFMSDVLAGWSLGIVCLMFALLFYESLIMIVKRGKNDNSK